ncbi:hypothetical protein [Amycolatopsis viridis]|uniref:Uncharacterized protein YaaN involved in tellurite resistance n=1 Tax=Amycolatopsis viridis TaxID=185678 RepID=A0ABX0SL21_9PSEU|nr:hypothetical protein [Amycolatopsis viridis]NIH77681.1 uncharacterized protein YaaN involved in tellurite resistance [Amycolatopsis viridis]
MTEEQNETRRLAIKALQIAREARDDAAAARVLATAASKDVGDLKAQLQAHTKVLNALRETQLEHGSRLGRVENRLGRVENRLGRVENRLDRVEDHLERMETEMRNGFAMMAGGMSRIAELLEGRES